ncbi:class I SAM-dependent methyltransferase [Candidatus Latescibacterota bacterium]
MIYRAPLTKNIECIHPMKKWYTACKKAASELYNSIPDTYRTRTFPGIIGDIKALSSKKALSLFTRKSGLGKQYAYLYMTQGIDGGKGYQACASEALSSVLGDSRNDIIHGKILDVGCAVGVTAGILSLENVTGFDLFHDLLGAAKTIDSLSSRRNSYVVSDMTGTWPYRSVFDTVICGLVCHHLKIQRDITDFFTNANQVLKQPGSLVITMPSGSISEVSYLNSVFSGIEEFGFRVNRKLSGIVLSDDSSHSLFWMFLIIAEKKSDKTGDIFIRPSFGFPMYRTPLTREEKGIKAKETAKKERIVRHTNFKFINIDDLEKNVSDKILVYSTLSEL